MSKKVGVLSKIVSIESVSDNIGEKVTVGVKRITRVLLKNPKFASALPFFSCKTGNCWAENLL